MPKTLDELLTILDVQELSPGVYRGHHPATVMQRSFGGQVLAQALASADRTVAPERTCHSLSAYFLRPGSTAAPIDFHVRATRDGGSFSTRQVTAVQFDREIFCMDASYKDSEGGFEHQVAPREVPRPPDACRPLIDVLGDAVPSRELWDTEWGVLDARYVSSTLDNPVDQRAAMSIWVRPNGSLPDDPRVHQQVLAYLSDLTILVTTVLPHDADFFGPTMQVATVNHSMWFHRPVRADGWVLYEQTSPSASNALGFSTGRLYAGGVLAASCAQEGLIRQLERPGAAPLPWSKE